MIRKGIKMKIFFDLLLCFAKIGLFTFGGGYAMISFIEDECVNRKKWITHDEMMNITVIAESTPGPVAINCATYVGYKKAGFWGAVFATVGMIIPSFAVIYIISVAIKDFLSYPIVVKAFKGIQVAVGILILNAAVNMIGKMKKKLLPLVIMIISFLAMMIINIFSFNFSSILIMLIAGVINLIIEICTGLQSDKGEKRL